MIGEIITATTRANKQAKALPKLTKTEPTVSDFLAWAAKVAVDRQGIQDEISDAVWWISDNPSLLAEFQLKQVEFQVPDEEDRRFLKDILTAIPGSVRMRLKADKTFSVEAIRSGTEYLATLAKHITDPEFEKISAKIFKMQNNTRAISFTGEMTPKYKEWAKNMEDIIHSRFCTYDMLQETLEILFEKYQPLVHKISRKWQQIQKDHKEANSVGWGELTGYIWDEVEIHEEQWKRLQKASGGKGKGGKGKGKGGKGKGYETYGWLDDTDDAWFGKKR